MDEKTKIALKNAKPRLDDLKVKEMIEMKANGLPVGTIAKHFGIKHSRVSRILSDLDVKSEIERIRSQRYEDITHYFRSLAWKAVENVARAIEEGDVKTSMELLKAVGITSQDTSESPTNVEIIFPNYRTKETFESIGEIPPETKVTVTNYDERGEEELYEK
jgi:hypothetical protein